MYDAKGVRLLSLFPGAPGPVDASFLGGKTEHRLRFGGGKGQLIAKAVGLKAGVSPHVVDATAGLARDAFVLASLGCRVTMLEREAWVRELLRHALQEARDSELQTIIGRMELIEVDAQHWLASADEAVADVIYLDPMYPHRDKSAKVKKEMRAFHELLGVAQDDTQLLAEALDKARFRVVVKRPRKGQAIRGPDPSYSLSGKSSRYDIYTLRSIDRLKTH